MKDKDKLVKLLDLISEDMRDDAEYYDGKPFNGKNVAEYNGKQGAAIQALANILKLIIEDIL